MEGAAFPPLGATPSRFIRQGSLLFFQLFLGSSSNECGDGAPFTRRESGRKRRVRGPFPRRFSQLNPRPNTKERESGVGRICPPLREGGGGEGMDERAKRRRRRSMCGTGDKKLGSSLLPPSPPKHFPLERPQDLT